MRKDTQQDQNLLKALIIVKYGEKLEYAQIGQIFIKDQKQAHALEEIIDKASNEQEFTEMLQKLDTSAQKILIQQIEQRKKKKDFIKAIAVKDGNNALLISKELGIKEFRNLKNIYQELSIEQLSSCQFNTENEKNQYFQAFKDKLKVLKIIIEASFKENKDVLKVFQGRYNEFSDNLKTQIKIRSHHLKGFFE